MNFVQNREEILLITETLAAHGFSSIEEIGCGGYAHVYKIFSDKYQQYFAAKVFSIKDTVNLSSFSAEIAALINLDHPNIIQIYNYFSDSKFLYIILEYCPNGSMQERICNGIGLIDMDLQECCKKILDSVEYCHKKKIAHTDIKLSNILFDQYNRIKLADFSLSRKLTANQSINSFSGTMFYVAPEILRLQKHDPFKSDVWSLGITFYVMATGRMPFLYKDAEQFLEIIMKDNLIVPNRLNEDLKEILRAMLRVDPSTRPTISELKEYRFFKNPSTQHKSRNDSENQGSLRHNYKHMFTPIKKPRCYSTAQTFVVKSNTDPNVIRNLRVSFNGGKTCLIPTRSTHLSSASFLLHTVFSSPSNQ